MIFIIKWSDTNKPIPVFMELNMTLENSVWNIYEDDKHGNLETYDGKYILRRDLVFNEIFHPFMKSEDSDIKFPCKLVYDEIEKGIKCNKKIEIWRSKYNEFEELIVVNGIITAIKVRTEVDLRNLLFGIRHEYKYIINFLIRQKKEIIIPRENLLMNVDPTNIVVSLKNKIQLSGSGEWFVNTKLDGVTCVVAYLKDLGGKSLLVSYELKGKGVSMGSREIFNIEVTDELWDTDIIFLGEYYVFDVSNVEKIYLFMEANDMNKDFRIDYKNMKKFKDNCMNEGISIIDINNIVIARNDEDYRGITKRILDIKSKLGEKFPEIDGLVYGRILNKFQLKWKSPELITIDFYCIIKNHTIYLYAAEKRRLALQKMRGGSYISKLRKLEGKKTIPVDLIIKKEIGSNYVLQLFTIQKYSKDMYIQVDKWKEKFNKRIVECKFLECIWTPYRIREDKKYPNNFRVAVDIFDTIKNPVKISDLLV